MSAQTEIGYSEVRTKPRTEDRGRGNWLNLDLTDQGQDDRDWSAIADEEALIWATGNG